MAVTYDFQTPGVSTSAADTQEDIRNIAEAAATGFNSSHTLSNIPTGAWRMESILTAANWQFYNGSSWDDMRFAKLHVYNNGLVLVNEIGVHTLEFIAMGDTPGYVTTGASSWFIQSDFLSVGTSTFDPILGFMNQGTERARIYTDTSDSHKLKFDVGGSDQMVIDSSGDVGIGTPTSSGKLNIKGEYSNYILSMYAQGGAQIGGLWQDASGHSELYLKNSSGVSKVLLSSKSASYFLGGKVGIGTSSPAGIIEASDTNARVYITSDSSNNSTLTFRNSSYYWNTLLSGATGSYSFYNGSVRMSIDSSGNVEVNTGNLVIGTSGKGIDFSATSGTGTSELLDDYEEGTFTPTFEPDSGSFNSITYNRRTGNYTKIGNTVHCWIDISTDLLTVGTASGGIHISGLPFTITAHSTALVGAQSGWITKAPDHAAVQSGQTKISLRWLDQSTQNYQNITTSNLKTGTNSDANRLMGISFSYKTS